MPIASDLARAIERRDPYSLGHADRVGVLAEIVAARLGWDEEEVEVLRLGAALHDIGKLAVPEEVLRKPGPLDPGELAQMRSHPEHGARMVSLVRSLRPALPCVLHHHERWDGRGYPAGKKGAEIPAMARVLAVADAFDAMISERAYRPALAPQEAIAELERGAGSQFDPDVVAVFVQAWREGAMAMPRPRLGRRWPSGP